MKSTEELKAELQRVKADAFDLAQDAARWRYVRRYFGRHERYGYLECRGSFSDAKPEETVEGYIDRKIRNP